MSKENVDDILISQMTGTQAPAKTEDVPHETSEESTVDVNAEQVAPKETVRVAPKEVNEYGEPEAEEEPKQTQNEPEDEYGLAAEQEEETERKYTKAELKEFANRAVRERLERMERNNGQQFTQQQVQQQAQAAQQGFQYNEDSNLDWQQQLEQFIDQASERREQRKAQQMQQAEEQRRFAALQSKFQAGMQKFADYTDVVTAQNFTDAMALAAEDIRDPAAFFYAAAKRAPEELAKIASMKSPYAQAAAIGRLDEKLKKQAKKLSDAPRPVHKTKSDVGIEHKTSEKRKQNLDEMLIEDQNKKIALLAQRRR